MRSNRLTWPGFVAFAVVVPAVAIAQPRGNAIPDANGGGIDTHLLRPALDSRGLLTVNGVDVLPAQTFSFGLTLDYGRGVLRLPDGATSTHLVSDSFAGTFLASYGIGNRAVVGVSAPVVGIYGDGVDFQGIANVAIHGKVRLTRPSDFVGLAVAAQVGVPVSDAPKNAGADPAAWYWPMLVAEKRFGPSDLVRFAINVGYRGHAASGTTLVLRDGVVRDGSRITYGAGASVRVADPLDLVAETYGTYLLGSSDAAVRSSNEALFGAKVFVEESSFLVVGAGPRVTGGFEAADVRALLGFIYEPPMGDRDGDGVRDDEDACVTKAGAKSSDPHKNGCPQDTDEDGATDAEDACPYVKGPLTRDASTNGCPPMTAPDRDKDGVPDTVDACPNDAGKPSDDPLRNGCPDVLLGEVELTLFDKINFRTASAEILPQSSPILDKVAVVLNDHPDLLRIEVGGHADERGDEIMNLHLTQARVDSVVEALVARNVERGRLRGKGYGFYCPIDSAHGEVAWTKNRRVEFLIVETTRGATGVTLGCSIAAKHGVKGAGVP